jgi:hypothetical protein
MVFWDGHWLIFLMLLSSDQVIVELGVVGYLETVSGLNKVNWLV